MRRPLTKPRNHCIRPTGARAVRRIALAKHGGDSIRLSRSALRVRILSIAWVRMLAGFLTQGGSALASARFVCEEGFRVTTTNR